jgi:hypothetical protein
MLSSRMTLKRFFTISAACSAFTLGLICSPDGVEIAAAQSAGPKTSAPNAPKDAPVAPAASANPSAPNAAPVPSATGSNSAAAPAPTENAVTPAPVPAVEPPPELAPQWRKVYEQGKSAMATGSFPLASRMLNDVALRSPDPALRGQAKELADLASYWAYNRVTLAPAATVFPGAIKPQMPLPDERTIDELAILYANTLVWGAGFGAVVGAASGSNDSEAFFLPAIGMSALGAGALAIADLKFGPLPYGMPQSITSGLYMGLEAGIFLGIILENENLLDDDDQIPGLIWGTATAGGLIGGLVGATAPMTPGRASFTSSGAIWGGVLTTFVTLGFLDGEFTSAPFITGLIGATAGGVSTGILGGSLAPSIARVRFIDVGAVGGGLLFGGLYASLADRTDDQALAFLSSAGIAVGLATSFYLTRNMDRDEPRRGNPPSNKPLAWRASPYMAPQPGGGTLGFSGTF